jgi:hypothetical protein
VQRGAAVRPKRVVSIARLLDELKLQPHTSTLAAVAIVDRCTVGIGKGRIMVVREAFLESSTIVIDDAPITAALPITLLRQRLVVP